MKQDRQVDQGEGIGDFYDFDFNGGEGLHESADDSAEEAPEFIYRPDDYHVVQLPVDKINICAQHRNGSNPVQRELNASISRRSLDNALLVTILTREQIQDYIDFTNRAWRSGARIDEFVPVDESGESGEMFALLVAGHSRLKACQADAESIGCKPSNYYEWARILDGVTTVDEIVTRQTEENLHAAPAPQNTAILMAEAWFWQKEEEAKGTVPRMSRKEFASKHCIGVDALRDALNFVDLPVEIRELTDDQLLPFSVAKEVGRAITPVKKYAKVVDPDNADELVRTELLRLATCYLRKQHRTAARQEIRVRVKGFRSVFEEDPTEQKSLENFMSLIEEPSPLERARWQLEEELRETQQRIKSGQIGLQNAIAELAQVDGVEVDLVIQKDGVNDAKELLEGETVKLG
ncbi:MAG: hypothetical protein Q8Q11_03800 [bacterium]|nr:hypothetical protein [bacterium]MDZ4248331.1 hypothetical protein [Patescibacteria group bacterium]